MDLWIGPAIIAAAVSGLISAIGWMVTFRVTIRLEQRRRDEKVRDFQIALRAEIASDLLVLEVVDRAVFLDDVTAAYHADRDYTPFVSRMASNMVFDTIVKEIHILPGAVITPVITYARLRQTIEKFIDDLRAAKASELGADRVLLMFADYFDMSDRLEALAQNAVAALDRSLGLSRPAADQPTQWSASERDGASAGKSEP